MRALLLVMLGATVLLAGCAKPMRYEWGGYDTNLYGYYKNPAGAENFRTSMEEQFKQLEARNMKPAPGLYAELGTLYLERGERAIAANWYAKERDAWPESRYLMETMLKNLERMAPRPKPQPQ